MASSSATSLAYPLFHPARGGDLPMMMSLHEFDSAFPEETGMLEFKQGVSEEKLREAVAAFSNSEGGVLLIGIGPDRSRHERRLSGEFTSRLHRIIGALRNPGRYDLHELTIGDTVITVIAVDRRREGFTQMNDGRVLVRLGAMNTPLFDQQLTRFITQRSLNRFENTATGIALEAADLELVTQVRDAFGWSAPDNLEERLTENGLLTRDTMPAELTVAGVLCLVRRPHEVLGKTVIDVFRFRDAGSVYDKRFEISGPLSQQVEEATSALLAELGSDVVVVGVRRHELPRIPEPVLREALANAVAHRVYESARQPIRIEMHPDRLVITSPGGLPEPVTLQSIREQNAARNVDMIRVLRRLRLAEDAGMGVDVMQDVMEAHLLEPPLFETDGSSVSVTLRTTSAVTARERAWVTELEARGEVRPGDRVLLVHASRGELLTNRVVRDLLAVDSIHARSALQRLRDLGLLVQSGQRGASSYQLAPGSRGPGSSRIDERGLRAAILDLGAEGAVTNETVRSRTGLDRAQVLALLTTMVEAGELIRTGQRRGTRYELPPAGTTLD